MNSVRRNPRLRAAPASLFTYSLRLRQQTVKQTKPYWRPGGFAAAGKTHSQIMRSRIEIPTRRFLQSCAVAIALSASAHGQFASHGLVGVGRIPADSFDSLGSGIDSLAGLFSSMAFDVSSMQAGTDASGNAVYGGTLYGQPDRGYSNGTTDFHPRIEVLQFSITPNYTATSASPAPQNQISLLNTATIRFKDALDQFFTGFDADSVNMFEPQSASLNGPAFNPTSGVLDAPYLGNGALSIDPEGIVRLPDGSFFTSDEYGPFIYHFAGDGSLLGIITPPSAFYPLDPNGQINFTANVDSISGRQNNKGFEGLGMTPDRKHLVAILQSPLQQDGPAATASQSSNGANGKNTRICVFDPTTGALEHEYIYTLANVVDAAGKAVKTTCSEIYALTDKLFLVDERDSLGRGSGKNTPPVYKSVVVVNADGATDIAGSRYDKAVGQAGQANLPSDAAGLVTAGLHAVTRQDLLNIVNSNELAKFGLNAKADTKTGISPDINSLSDKWEGLALVPFFDPTKPNQFLLLIGNDNDFKANAIYENGVLVGGTGSNGVEPGAIDTMLLAYNVTLPFDTSAPQINSPATLTVAADANCAALLPDVTALSTFSDNNGPADLLSIAQTPSTGTPVGLGSYFVTITATDPSGNQNTSVTKVNVTDQTAPTIQSVIPSTATLWPPDNKMVPVQLSAALFDNCDPHPNARIISVQSSERTAVAPKNATDFELTGALTLNLRAQRDPNGPGRVYTITVQATDAAGNSATRNVQIVVPRDQNKAP
jgi:hypothetical protein